MVKLKKILFGWYDEKKAIDKAERTDEIARAGELVASEAHQCIASYKLAKLHMVVVHR